MDPNLFLLTIVPTQPLNMLYQALMHQLPSVQSAPAPPPPFYLFPTLATFNITQLHAVDPPFSFRLFPVLTTAPKPFATPSQRPAATQPQLWCLAVRFYRVLLYLALRRPSFSAPRGLPAFINGFTLFHRFPAVHFLTSPGILLLVSSMLASPHFISLSFGALP